MLIVFVGVVLFGLKHWQETNRLNENSISSKDNDILGPQSDVKGGKLEVHDPMEDKTERPLGDSSSSDDNQNSIVDSANKKKRVAVATYIHKVHPTLPIPTPPLHHRETMTAPSQATQTACSTTLR